MINESAQRVKTVAAFDWYTDNVIISTLLGLDIEDSEIKKKNILVGSFNIFGKKTINNSIKQKT
jgi:hypothetical protein